MKAQLTYAIFALFAIVVIADLVGRITHNWELQLMPELSEAIRCVLVCWFGKGVYDGVTSWIEKRAGKVIEQIGEEDK
ncbi:MAG: hypothetical protein K2X93_06755 [Candidatus Obscuribacterales bacterium]|nr:hypothetical protein [Candidatus Obscuribacterales bacterium]